MKEKFRILNVLTVIEDGGMETLVSNIYEGLYSYDNFDFYTCSLVISDKTFVTEKLEKYSKELFYLGVKNKNLSIKDYLNLFIKIFSLAKYISDNKIDVVNSHDFFSGSYTRLAVLISRFIFFYKPKRNCVTLHNIFFWLNKKHHLINKFLSYSTDKIICVSRSVYEYSKEHDKINDNKYNIILNGIDENQFIEDPGIKDYYKKEFNVSGNDFIIGNIGTLSIRKGHIYLVKAFKLLTDKFPNVKLLIFGSSRGHEQDVKNEVYNYVKENNLEQKIIFMDSRSDIRKIYNIFDIFVMSSVSEGLSLAAIEAMLMERLCVFSDIGPFRELITDNVNGLLFKSKDHESLFYVLYNAVNNYKNYSDFGNKARMEIISKYSYRNMIKQYYTMYKI